MKFVWAILGLFVVAGASRAGIYNTTEVDDIRLSTDVYKFPRYAQ